MKRHLGRGFHNGLLDAAHLIRQQGSGRRQRRDIQFVAPVSQLLAGGSHLPAYLVGIALQLIKGAQRTVGLEVLFEVAIDNFAQHPRHQFAPGMAIGDAQDVAVARHYRHQVALDLGGRGQSVGFGVFTQQFRRPDGFRHFPREIPTGKNLNFVAHDAFIATARRGANALAIKAALRRHGGSFHHVAHHQLGGGLIGRLNGLVEIRRRAQAEQGAEEDLPLVAEEDEQHLARAEREAGGGWLVGVQGKSVG